MSDQPDMNEFSARSPDTLERVRVGLAARYRRERRFRMYGLMSTCLGLLFVLFLFVSIISNGYTAFWQTQVRLEIDFDAQLIDPDGTGDAKIIGSANFDKLVRTAVGQLFPEVTDRRGRRSLNRLMSAGAGFCGCPLTTRSICSSRATLIVTFLKARGVSRISRSCGWTRLSPMNA
jgi:phosphate transport system permease protein